MLIAGGPRPSAASTVVAAERVMVPAADGYPIAATVFVPTPNDSGRLVVINSATGVKRTYYERFARYLAARGLTVATYDYRGVGDSRPRDLRRLRATMREWGTLDQEGMLAWGASRAGTGRVALLGHSVGGQLLGLTSSNARIERAVFVAAQHGYWRHWTTAHRYVLAALWYAVMPAVTRLAGYFPSPMLGLGEPLPAGVALEWARWCRDPRALAGATNDPIREGFRRVTAPILALSFSDDQYAPRGAAAALLDFYERSPREHRHVLPSELGVRSIGHFGFFKEGVCDALWRDVAEWLAR